MRMAHLCKWNIQVNSLWQWGYCLLVLMGEGYLMYRAVLKCKEYNELPWNIMSSSDNKPVSELYAYIALVVISIMCMPFFFITAIFKIGNFPNDGLRLGRDDIIPVLPGPEGGDEDGSDLTHPTILQILWRHSGPLCVGFHLVAAFCFLLPNTLIDAQKIKYGILAKSKW